jgi:hypothetical protein
MNDLPFEIKLMIFDYLELNDILRLPRLSKEWNKLISSTETWNFLFFKRFKRESDHPLQEYQLLDRQSRFKSAKELHIAWSNDDRYWRIEDSQTAKSGSLALLRVVFWMHVIAEFKHVSPGLYEPRIQLYIPRRFAMAGSNTVFSIDCLEQGIHQEITFSELQNQIEFDTNLVLKLPLIKLSSISQVAIQMKETDNQKPKQGLVLDCFELVRKREPEEKQTSFLTNLQAHVNRIFFG